MSLALYRRYRPESFEEVIGQDHVTRPLQRALRNQRVNHAYLFSGPRGCGKTTSARILARCLNCEQGPTPTPCGVCNSCTDLARGGPGSIDVIEIDAASHGGVDDARDLRERAFFAPVSARYKIYILDEAHMVSPAGFNALLKVVEEPPPHLKFIFATTEPEKVIGTIRSRTHHYPFRLVPPGVLRDYLAALCDQEQVKVEPEALPLVVRAGAGSVRDSLSVLDQLLGAAGADGVTYQMAVGLLGYTDSTLLDEAVAAFATGDGAAAFQAVDHVVEGGHEPRRFLADLLERLRDLLILGAVPDAVEKGLVSVPADQLARMREQAAAFGPAQLSRAADLVNAGLLEMRGATAPRLLLELVCARILLPGADDSPRGLGARLERLERDAVVGTAGSARPTPAHHVSDAASSARQPQPQQQQQQQQQQQPGSEPHPPRLTVVPPAPGEAAAGPALEPPPWLRESTEPRPMPTRPDSAIEPGGRSDTRGSDPSPPPAGAGGAAAVRRAWPDVVDAVRRRSKVAWVLVSQNVTVVGAEGRTLQLGFTNPGLRDNFPGSKSEDALREALREVTGTDWRIDPIVDPSAGGAGGQPARGPHSPPMPAQTRHLPDRPSATSSDPAAGTAGSPGGDWRDAGPREPEAAASPPATSPIPDAASADEDWSERDLPEADDETAPAPSEPTARELLIKELGATVLEEGAAPD